MLFSLKLTAQFSCKFTRRKVEHRQLEILFFNERPCAPWLPQKKFLACFLIDNAIEIKIFTDFVESTCHSYG